jgi:hypothetical protein
LIFFELLFFLFFPNYEGKPEGLPVFLFRYSSFLGLLQLSYLDMSSTYTPELVRAYVDDVDACFRQAIVNNDLSGAFVKEQKRLVSHS